MTDPGEPREGARPAYGPQDGPRNGPRDGPSDAEADGASGPSSAVRLAAALVALEALGLVALAVFELVSIDPDRPSVGITTAIFFLVYAAGLAASARGLVRLRTWSRGPVVLAQLIELGVAWSFYGNDTVWVAALLAVPAVVVLVIVLSPSTTEALYGRQAGDAD